MCMITTAVFLFFQGERRSNGELASIERITIGCGATFFVSFFVAMSVELKAKRAIHYIIRRFIRYGFNSNTALFIPPVLAPLEDCIILFFLRIVVAGACLYVCFSSAWNANFHSCIN